MSSDQQQTPQHVVPQGPVFTEALFDKIVATIEYHLFDGTSTIVCTLKLRNGFAVTGQAHVLPTGQFDPNMGMQLSLQDAKTNLARNLSVMVYDMVCPDTFRIGPAIQYVLDTLKESANG